MHTISHAHFKKGNIADISWNFLHQICRPCRDDVTRVLSNPSYVPKWEKGKARQQSNDCYIAECSSTSVALPSIASAEALEHILREGG